jgi:hypothetical protein
MSQKVAVVLSFYAVWAILTPIFRLVALHTLDGAPVLGTRGGRGETTPYPTTYLYMPRSLCSMAALQR